MSTFADLSGNGKGVVVDPGIANILPAGADVTVPNKVTKMRAKGAGNIIMRAPGSSADITLAVADGESIPVQPGTIIRNTGTTVTALHAMQDRSLL